MTLFILGLVIFFGAHVFSALRSREPGKDLKKKMGYGPYMAAYTFVSIVGFYLICVGFNATRTAGLVYQPPSWGQHLNFALMPPALILLVASQLPTGRIKKWAKHPMLVAVKLWALGHLFANGELNSFLLFGSFLTYAIFDRIMVKRRGDNGPAPDTPVSTLADVGSVVIGIVLYVAIVWYLHPILFSAGRSVIPQH
ncbi:MAG: NnrU family protein [Hyphomonadaceae bacterium BRH_c29]|nr:MAG: NnrU family protein [Hyphomonadaceae bacterium BRH_c29]